MKDIYYNGIFYIKKDLTAKAMGVENGRIAVVGDMEDIKKWSEGKEVSWHDMKSSFIVPGFQDSHMHLLYYGYGLSLANLSEHTSSLSNVLQALIKFKNKQNIKRGDWIIGRGWNQDYFTDEERFPNRYDLDKVSTESPIIIYRACCHIACVNSRALQAAGVTASTAQPGGGCFDVDNKGEPTGVLREYGINLVSQVIPLPGKEEIKNYILQAIKKLGTYGITSVQSDDLETFSGVPYEMVLSAYRELDQEGILAVKVYEQCRLSHMDTLKDFLSKGYRTGAGSPFFTIGPIKIIADGSLGARTAYLSKPYEDDAEKPNSCGIAIYSQKELDERIGYAHRYGMQVAVHAIGDRAMEMTIHALEKAMKEKTDNKLRHGIIHCQITTKKLLKDFQKWNLHAYIQSIFLDNDNHVVEKRVGKERAMDTYQYRTLLELGLDVSNGSDAPVECPDVLGGIQCAVTRTTLDRTKTFLANQAITVEQALETYTAMGARASFEEKEKGMLMPGMAADFTVLSKDIRNCPPETIKDAVICQTFVDGNCVYERKSLRQK